MGVITGSGVGTTTILMINHEDGSFAKCKVTVKKKTKVGNVFTKSGLQYKVTSTKFCNRTLTCTGRSDKKKLQVKIPDTVIRNGISYKVTAIGDKAFRGSKVQSLAIGKNVKNIGVESFAGCKSLKQIQIKGTKLAKIGSKAFYGVNSKAVFKVPASKLDAYRKLLTSKVGYKKTMKVEKI